MLTRVDDDLEDLRRQAKRAARARQAAEKRSREAIHAEDLAIEALAEALGTGRGVAAEVARVVQRTPEHVRNVLNSRYKRGSHAATSSADSTDG